METGDRLFSRVARDTLFLFAIFFPRAVIASVACVAPSPGTIDLTDFLENNFAGANAPVCLPAGNFTVRHAISVPNHGRVSGVGPASAIRIDRRGESPDLDPREGAVFTIGTMFSSGDGNFFPETFILMGLETYHLTSRESYQGAGGFSCTACKSKVQASAATKQRLRSFADKVILVTTQEFFQHSSGQKRMKWSAAARVHSIVGDDDDTFRIIFEDDLPALDAIGEELYLGISDQFLDQRFPGIIQDVSVSDLALDSRSGDAVADTSGVAAVSTSGVYRGDFSRLTTTSASLIGGNLISHSSFSDLTGTFSRKLVDTGYSSAFNSFQRIYGTYAPGPYDPSVEIKAAVIQHGEGSHDNDFGDISVTGCGSGDTCPIYFNTLFSLRGNQAAEFHRVSFAGFDGFPNTPMRVTNYDPTVNMVVRLLGRDGAPNLPYNAYDSALKTQIATANRIRNLTNGREVNLRSAAVQFVSANPGYRNVQYAILELTAADASELRGTTGSVPEFKNRYELYSDSTRIGTVEVWGFEITKTFPEVQQGGQILVNGTRYTLMRRVPGTTYDVMILKGAVGSAVGTLPSITGVRRAILHLNDGQIVNGAKITSLNFDFILAGEVPFVQFSTTDFVTTEPPLKFVSVLGQKSDYWRVSVDGVTKYGNPTNKFCNGLAQKFLGDSFEPCTSVDYR